MKNIKRPFSLFLCLVFLFTSTVSQAVNAPTSAIKRKIKTPGKKQVKLERLKQKLSKRMARMKQKQKLNERAYTGKKSKRALNMAILMVVSLIFCASFMVFLNQAFAIFLSMTLAVLSITNFSVSDQALMKIKNSFNPEQYKKSKYRIGVARVFSILGLLVMALFAAGWYYLTYIFSI